MKTQFTLHGMIIISGLIFILFCLLGCSEKVEIEPVKWSQNERCLIIWGRPCGDAE